MPALVLVKHAAPAIDPTIPPDEWPLSDAGRRRCAPLADQLAATHPGVIVASAEAKARETARLVAERLGVPWEIGANLHEHDRRGELFGTEASFQAAVAAFFAQPGALVYGNETADQAHARFARAVDDVLAEHPAQNVVIVAHGTVITLLVARANRLEPFAFWQRLGLPSFVLLSRPALAVQRVVERIL